MGQNKTWNERVGVEYLRGDEQKFQKRKDPQSLWLKRGWV